MSVMPALAGLLLSRPAKWPSAALAAAVFAFLDVLDLLLCLVYAVLDAFLEESPVACYCHRTHHGAEEEDEGVSDTLYARRSAFRGVLLGLLRKVGVGRRTNASPEKARSPRWSDCGCATCLAWRSTGGGRLHFVVKEPMPAPKVAAATTGGDRGPEDDAIFIHGFTSSSSFWARTVFPELDATNLRLFAVDLLGFGDSPKPANCAYTLRDHVEAIERSLIDPLNLTSFHLISHSMGCTVAIALEIGFRPAILI